MAWLIQRGKIFYVGWNDGTKDRYESAHTTDAVIAETKRLEKELAQSKPHGQEFIPNHTIALDSLISLYTKSADISSSTVRLNLYSWKKMRTLTGATILNDLLSDSFVKELKDKAKARMLSPAYISMILRDTRKLLEYAVIKGFILKNPLKKVTLPEQEPVARFITPDEEQRILAECSDELARIVKIALNVGLRVSQISSLTWKQIDLEHHLIYVPKQKRQRSRRIPIFHDTLSLCGPRKLSGQVFTMNTEQIKQAFRRVIRRLRGRKAIHGRIRFHDLRHTCASRLAQILEPAEVRDYFGWSSISMVDRYTHTTLTRIREKIERAANNPQTLPKFLV